MRDPKGARKLGVWAVSLWLCAPACWAQPAARREVGTSPIAGSVALPVGPGDSRQPAVFGSTAPSLQPRSRTILNEEVRPIDLNTALRLAGVQNPELLVARQRVVEAVAQRQLAAVQIIPSFNGGTSYDTHTGNLQQSNGNILSVNRSALYVGAGSNAVAAGTVLIPGLLLTGNVAEGLFRYLGARQMVRQSEFASLAVRNQAFLRVCEAYCDLLQAEGRRAIA